MSTAALAVFVGLLVIGIAYIMRQLGRDTREIMHHDAPKKLTTAHFTHIAILLVLACLLAFVLITLHGREL